MSYITIYFDDKPVYLSDNLSPEIDEARHHPDTVFIDELSTAAINSLLHEINKKQFHAGIILSENLEKLKKEYKFLEGNRIIYIAATLGYGRIKALNF